MTNKGHKKFDDVNRLSGYLNTVGVDVNVQAIDAYEEEIRESKDRLYNQLLSAKLENVEFLRGGVAAIELILQINDTLRESYKKMQENNSEKEVKDV